MHQDRIAPVAWYAMDVQAFESVEHWTPQEAERFLRRHERIIQEAMVKAGWGVIEQMIAEELAK